MTLQCPTCGLSPTAIPAPNNVSAFLEARTIADPTAFVSASLLYDEYVKWSQSHNVVAVGKIRMGMILEALGYPPIRTATARLRAGLRMS